ncbi:MAG: HAMP domain-containing protein [Acidobacteria bacterium]|nr:HAMP domain-containing protein [Acidobacteriota bacterium]
MSRSFTFRLAAAFTGIGVAAAALTAILVNLAFGGRFTRYVGERQEVRERQIVAALVDSYVGNEGWDRARLDALAPMVLMDGSTLRVEDALGRGIWETSEGAVAAHMARMHRNMMMMAPLGAERRIPIDTGTAVVGFAVLRTPESGFLPADVAFRASVNRLLLAGGIAAGVVALVLGIALARRATAPARALTSAARALATGDRARRVEAGSGDEFGEMAQAFNLMADTIEEEDRLRRGFAADVAHELRTPLAILRSQVEALQDGIAKPSPPALASLHEEVLRLSRLVADLETLARADAAGFSLEPRPVALGALVRDAVNEFAGPFEAEGVRVETDLGEVTVEADATRLRQVVSNLLSNALKFSPAGSAVRVDLAREESWAVLRVADSGPGIPSDEVARVFDRFFRGSGNRTGGSGIGLTVVRELVRAHGGEVEVSSEFGKGTRFTVRLPVGRVSAAAHPASGAVFPAGGPGGSA